MLPGDVTNLGDWNDELDIESILQALGVEYSTDPARQGTYVKYVKITTLKPRKC